MHVITMNNGYFFFFPHCQTYLYTEKYTSLNGLIFILHYFVIHFYRIREMNLSFSMMKIKFIQKRKYEHLNFEFERPNESTQMMNRFTFKQNCLKNYYFTNVWVKYPTDIIFDRLIKNGSRVIL